MTLTYRELREWSLAKLCERPEKEAEDVSPQGYAATVAIGKSHEPSSSEQVHYQKCGGGRRVIKKRIV